METPKTIKVLDDRFYLHGEEFYPSVTTILKLYPKGNAIMKWVAEHGLLESNRLKGLAAYKGSLIHETIEKLIKGTIKKVEYKNFEEDEWRYMISFVNFWNDFQCETITTEKAVYSHDYKYAGTLDWEGFVTEKGERKLVRIDWKTSNYFYPEYDLQLSAYEMAEREDGKPSADELWVVRFGTQTKRGYSIHKVTVEKMEFHFETFLMFNNMWRRLNPTAKPFEKDIPVELSININNND